MPALKDKCPDTITAGPIDGLSTLTDYLVSDADRLEYFGRVVDSAQQGRTKR
jgi:hypothetical protein